MPEQTGHDITAVPVPGRTPQDAGDVHVFGDGWGTFFFTVTELAEPTVEFFVLFVEEVTDVLHDRYRIGFLLRMLSEFHQVVEQFVDVGHVEIPCDDEVARHQLFCADHPVVLAELLAAR